MICKTIGVSLFKREKNLYINIKLNFHKTLCLGALIPSFYKYKNFIGKFGQKMAQN